MHGLIYNGIDLGQWCQAKTVYISPLQVKVDGETHPYSLGAKPVYCGLDVRTVKVKLLLDAGRRLDYAAAAALRHQIEGVLATVRGATLQLPEEDELEYRNVVLADAGSWDELFEKGSTVLTFSCYNPVAFGPRRESPESAFHVYGTWETYPTYELVALEGDSVIVIDEENERYICLMDDFAGGENVIIDADREIATINGEDASAKVALQSTFFGLMPGDHELTFAGCSAHKIVYEERWV